MPSERSFGFLEDILRHIDLAETFVGKSTFVAFEKRHTSSLCGDALPGDHIGSLATAA